MSNGGDPHAGLPWALLGAGGHARSVYDVILRRGYVLSGLCADSERPRWLEDEYAMEGLGRLASWYEPVQWLVAIGDPRTREHLTSRLGTAGQKLGTLVARSATVAGDAELGAGVMIMEHAHVGPGAKLGTSTVVNTSAVVEHDCRVGNFCHVAPCAVLLGSTVIGKRVVVGASAVVLPGIEVGNDVLIGAQSAVTRAVGPNLTVYGVPARTRATPPSHEVQTLNNG